MNCVAEILRGLNEMSKEFALTTLIELAISILLIYGFMHEEKIIAFEENIKRIVIGNYRRWKRMRGKKKCMKK